MQKRSFNLNNQLKIAQVWKSSIDEDDFYNHLGNPSFYGMMYVLHEMEYKYNMFRLRPFKGHPKRQENILKGLENALGEAAVPVSNLIQRVFKKWLDHHDGSKPEIMAQTAVSKWMMICPDLQELSTHLSAEKYPFPNWLEDNIFHKQPEYVKNFFAFILPMTIDEEVNMLRSIGHETYGEYYGQTFSSEDEAVQWVVNKYSPETFNPSAFDMDTYMSLISQYQRWIEIFITKYLEEVVIADWQKTDEVREVVDRVRGVYERLQSSSELPVERRSSLISEALQTAHVNGPMVNHITGELEDPNEDAKQALDFLSGESDEMRENVELWNQQLRDIGLEI